MATSDAGDAGNGRETATSESDERSDKESRDAIPPKDREDAKERDKHRCQFCSARGPGADGVASLHVHHIEADPDHCERHDLDNLVTMCEGCHNWLHKKPSAADVPIMLTDADKTYLRPHDYEILSYLYDEGPAMASDITDALLVDVTEVAVRERLWLLMGLDEIVACRDEQILDRDAETGEWGSPDQIAHSDRGRIPGDVQVLIQRIEDEWVRQAIERGCSREIVADVLEVHPRTTYQKEYRAYACAFPLDALSNGDDVANVLGEGDEEGRMSVEHSIDPGEGVGPAQSSSAGAGTAQQSRRTTSDTDDDATEISYTQNSSMTWQKKTEEEVSEETAAAIERAIAALENLRE